MSIPKIFLTFICLCFATATYAATTTHKTLIDDHYVVYDTAGTGQEVLLLHGVFASRTQWKDWLTLLSKRHNHVIAPDLPGFGQSQGFPEKDYALETQVKLLHQLIVKLHLHHINIAGNSMGGLIAALYAKEYPADISTLAFIGAPLGVHSPEKSRLDHLIEAGQNPFIPLTKEQFNQELQLLYSHPPEINEEMINTILAKNKNEQSKDSKIWDIIQKHNSDLASSFPLSMPTLIIWGDSDHVFDVSGAPLLQKNIPGSKLVIIKNGSHLLFMEEPQLVTDNYLNFVGMSNDKRNYERWCKQHPGQCSKKLKMFD